jgi:Domain of unknown function (DUF4124)
MRVTKRWSITAAAGLCLACQVVIATETAPNYSWVDKNGERHYGDSVPPEYAQSERRVLNSQGVEIQHVDAEKNAAQRADQLKRDRALQDREQHDNFLLTTYTSTKDIERLRDERLDQLDGQIKAASAYIDTLDARLKTLQARALLFKPYNKKPDARRMPDDLAEQLVRAASDLRTQHKAMDKRRQDQTDMRAQFEADIARYRELTASRSSG